MWFVWLSAGACIGVLVMCMVKSNSGAECLNCEPLLEANQMIAAREADIRACCERIKTLERANAALRGMNKRLVFENQQTGFFHAKEA